MKAYLSGPITGKPDNNRRAFQLASENLRQFGWEIVSPEEADVEWETTGDVPLRSPLYDTLISRDIQMLMACQAIIFLPGSGASWGAGLEAVVADYCGLASYDYWGGIAHLRTFWSFVNKAGSTPIPKHAPELGQCWLWEGGPYKTPYGQFHIPGTGKHVQAHRFAYTESFGPIPDATPHIDHICWNTKCVRPSHLEAVTQAENNKRLAMRRTHCPAGLHELSGINLIMDNGARRCRICTNERQRLRHSRGKQRA